jgi:hypothetical protein
LAGGFLAEDVEGAGRLFGAERLATVLLYQFSPQTYLTFTERNMEGKDSVS